MAEQGCYLVDYYLGTPAVLGNCDGDSLCFTVSDQFVTLVCPGLPYWGGTGEVMQPEEDVAGHDFDLNRPLVLPDIAVIAEQMGIMEEIKDLACAACAEKRKVAKLLGLHEAALHPKRAIHTIYSNAYLTVP